MDDNINEDKKRTFLRPANIVLAVYTVLVLGVSIFSSVIYNHSYQGNKSISGIDLAFKIQSVFGLIIIVYTLLFVISYFFIGEKKVTKYEKLDDSIIGYRLTTTMKYLLYGFVGIGLIYNFILFVNALRVAYDEKARDIYRADITNSFMFFILLPFVIAIFVIAFKSKEIYREEITEDLSKLDINKFRVELNEKITKKLNEFKEKNDKLKERINNNQKLLASNTIEDSLVRKSRQNQIEDLQKLLSENEANITKLQNYKTNYEKKFKDLEAKVKGEVDTKSSGDILTIINRDWKQVDTSVTAPDT